jgi:hypothetical protein
MLSHVMFLFEWAGSRSAGIAQCRHALRSKYQLTWPLCM